MITRIPRLVWCSMSILKCSKKCIKVSYHLQVFAQIITIFSIAFTTEHFYQEYQTPISSYIHHPHQSNIFAMHFISIPAIAALFIALAHGQDDPAAWRANCQDPSSWIITDNVMMNYQCNNLPAAKLDLSTCFFYDSNIYAINPIPVSTSPP